MFNSAQARLQADAARGELGKCMQRPNSPALLGIFEGLELPLRALPPRDALVPFKAPFAQDRAGRLSPLTQARGATFLVIGALFCGWAWMGRWLLVLCFCTPRSGCLSLSSREWVRHFAQALTHNLPRRSFLRNSTDGFPRALR